MGIGELTLVAFGLAMDAFAVSISSGIVLKQNLFKNAIRFGMFLGGFQSLMPLLGWLAGIQFREYIVEIDHWIAFILLGFIGIKMVRESFTKDNGTDFDPSQMKVLLFLAVATSIDALAAGISFAFLEVNIIYAVALIGVITCIISFIGVIIGDRFSRIVKKKAELLGGLVLISIGFKILIEHTETAYMILKN